MALSRRAAIETLGIVLPIPMGLPSTALTSLVSWALEVSRGLGLWRLEADLAC